MEIRTRSGSRRMFLEDAPLIVAPGAFSTLQKSFWTVMTGCIALNHNIIVTSGSPLDFGRRLTRAFPYSKNRLIRHAIRIGALLQQIEIKSKSLLYLDLNFFFSLERGSVSSKNTAPIDMHIFSDSVKDTEIKQLVLRTSWCCRLRLP